jgi:hypothetical protein
VTILRNRATIDETVWENEFFNRSVRAVDAYGVTRVPDPLPEKLLTRNRAGNLGVNVQYVLGQDVVGKVVASDPQIGVDLYRVDGPLVVAVTHVRGLYPNDTWSGRHVTYSRSHCSGGTLTVQLATDGSLYTSTQTVVAREHGNLVGRASIPPTATTQLVVPLHSRSGTCSIEFDVARTLVPGHGDTRALGAHFLFDYSS